MDFLFWSSLLTLFYIYLGYPLLIYLWARVRPLPVGTADHTPFITILISAYNEEREIGKTIENKLLLTYPVDRYEIIVISDGSTDCTEEIVRRYAGASGDLVRLLVQSQRQGKTAALNRAVAEARGELLVFSDANSLYAPDVLIRLARNFADPRVGYVTGKMVYGVTGETGVGDGCSAYMRYENFLRSCETRAGSVVGVDGGIDAMRVTLYRPMRADQLPDFVQPLMVVEQGFRVVYEPEALLREEALKSGRAEYRMRVRVALRALWALKDMRNLLWPGRDPLFAIQLFSHKVLRYLAFVFMLLLLFANATLWTTHGFYRLTMILQVLFYVSAGIGYLQEQRGTTSRWFYLPYYFVLINTGAAHAFLKFVAGKKQILWTPRTG